MLRTRSPTPAFHTIYAQKRRSRPGCPVTYDGSEGAERRQLAVLGKKLGRKALAEVATIATPDTILRWYRQLVAKKYDGSALRGPGRPRTGAEIVRLLVEMATRNTGWGYTRLRGALKNVGYTVGRNTIKRIAACSRSCSPYWPRPDRLSGPAVRSPWRISRSASSRSSYPLHR